MPYYFNGRMLHEPGYYTAVYNMSACDSVVGLTLSIGAGTHEFSDQLEVLNVDVYSILGQLMGQVSNLEAVNELSLKTGCYILRIHTIEGILSKKIIIQ